MRLLLWNPSAQAGRFLILNKLSISVFSLRGKKNLKPARKGTLLFSQRLQAPICKHVWPWAVPDARVFGNTQLLWGAVPAAAVSAAGDWNSDTGWAWTVCFSGWCTWLEQLQALLALVGGEGWEILYKAPPTWTGWRNNLAHEIQAWLQ